MTNPLIRILSRTVERENAMTEQANDRREGIPANARDGGRNAAPGCDGASVKGRPRNAMTRRRLQVLSMIAETSQRPSWCEIARRCGLHDYRSAKRIVRDLERMGQIEGRI